MENKFICSSCGYMGKPKKKVKGNFLIEVILWLFFIIPGVIYSIWRLSQRPDICPKCGNATMIPVDSPMGQKLSADVKSIDYQPKEVDNSQRTIKIRVLLIVVLIILFGVAMSLITSNVDKKQQQKKQSFEKAAAKPADPKVVEQHLKELTDMLNKFDSSKCRGSVEQLEGEFAQFVAWSVVIKEAKASSDQEIKNAANKLETKVKQIQEREFPIMRKEYGKLVGQKLWEHNVEVEVDGLANSNITFTAGMFADNGRIKAFHEEVYKNLQKYRFDKANYRWIEHADEYTQFTLESKKDGDLSD